MPRHSSDKPTVSSLHYYPIKSCMGIDLREAQIIERGIKDDRGWLIIGDDNVAVTQRDLAAMVHICAEVISNGGEGSESGSEGSVIGSEGSVIGGEGSVIGGKSSPNGSTRSLLLRAPQMPDLEVPEVDMVSNDDGATVYGANTCHTQLTVSVWGDPCQAVDQGAEASEWLSCYLKHKVRLVRMSRDNVRTVPLKKKESFEGVVGFADVYPFLVISQASLDDLNSRLKEPVPMNRFRPNIVIDGVEPFAEDTWTLIKIGDIRFAIDKPCARCVIVTIDQNTGEQFKEPLSTLATYRREDDNKVMFGQNAVADKTGSIKVGDPVEILKV